MPRPRPQRDLLARSPKGDPHHKAKPLKRCPNRVSSDAEERGHEPERAPRSASRLHRLLCGGSDRAAEADGWTYRIEGVESLCQERPRCTDAEKPYSVPCHIQRYGTK